MRRRELLACALGGTVAFGHGWLTGRTGRGRGRAVMLFAADLAAHLVYGLDADAFVRFRTRIERPVQLLGPRTRQGAVSVVSAGASLDEGPFESIEIDLEGEIVSRVECAPPRRGPRRVEAFESGRDRGPILDVASSRDPRKCWLLRASGATDPARGSRLERWVRPAEGGRWRRAFLFELPFSARVLVEHGGAAWVAGDRVCTLQVVRNDGRTVLRRTLPDADGVEAIAPAPSASGGGVWLAACGAIVRVNRLGRRMPGQGGFAHLISLRTSPRPDVW